MQKFKKIHGSGTPILIISNEEMNDIMKIVQAVEDSNILLKGVTRKLLTGSGNEKGKGIVRAGTGRPLQNKKGKGIVRAGTGKQWDF